MKRIVLLAILATMLCGVAHAVRPNTQIHYQGVLRDDSGQPLSGSYSMVFRFFSDVTGGDEILIDTHAGVVVDNGLFSVNLGGVGPVAEGVVTDGSGPGVYGFLPAMFGAYANVFLQVEVAGEALSPRTRIVAAPFAHSTRYVNGVEVAGQSREFYVNAAIGDDNNSGLSPSAATRTIQAAVDRISSIVDGYVTVHIADGIYDGPVVISDRIARSNGGIKLQGEPHATLSNPGGIGTGILAHGIHYLVLEELTVENYDVHGIMVRGGDVDLLNCSATGNNYSGLQLVESAFANVSGGSYSGNGYNGMTVQNGTNVVLYAATFDGNQTGLVAQNTTHVQVQECSFSSNLYNGISLLQASAAAFYDVDISNNTQMGMWISYGSFAWFYGPGTINTNGIYGIGCDMAGQIDLNGRSDVTLLSNGTCSLRADDFGRARGYGSAQTDPGCDCSPNTHGDCWP